MGNRQKGRETESWELDEISNLVCIPRYQLDKIYKDFRRVSKNYLLDKTEFRRIYKDLKSYSPNPPDYPHLCDYEINRRNNAMADRIFKTFDRDNTGRLTFNEFISAYILLQSAISPERRLQYLFQQYSQDDGYLTPIMGRRMIENMSDLYGVNTDYQQVWKSLEAYSGSQNGHIPQAALKNYFLNDPAYASAFCNGVQVPLPPPSPQF
ncbi:unnamed protein product [Rotaria socialis]|uniref:EF-hand domain-containing protein n=1 Tax=Rotaria socialis TaxID=392032 RepID=A0A820ZBI7_9BILA|nr:unnamed protein product [Rotaria socialis]CAF4560149.1 unnamed protein product [Rotaria socialis]